MKVKKEENSLSYVEKAVISLQETLFNSKKNMLEAVNRANKGELFVLQFLAMNNKNVLPSVLSEALQVSTARISALLGALEKKGQIVRDIDKNNRRNILVVITEKGRERVEAELTELKRRIAQVFIEMGEENTADFIRLMSQFSELMQKHLPQEECTEMGLAGEYKIASKKDCRKYASP